MRRLNNRSGVSIIAVVFLIVVVAFLGVIVVSLFVTQSAQSVGELNSTQALYIADGGIEYIIKNRESNRPNYSMRVIPGSALSLGGGTFVVDTPAYLTGDINNTVTTISPVNDTSTFPSSGRIVIGSELIDYTGKTANSFTGATRGAGLPATGASSHLNGDAIYPVAYLSATLSANPAACPSVNTTTGFLPQGVIKIDSEYIFYSDISSGTSFASCIRGFKGSTVAAHTVTGISVPSVYQYVITSTGSVSTIFGGTAQRVVKVTVGQ